MAKTPPKIGWQIIRKSFYSFLALILLIIAYVRYKVAIAPMLSPKLHQDLKKYMGTVFIISITFIIHKVVAAILLWYKENVAAKTKTKLDDKIIPLISRTLGLAVWVIALLVILPFYGVNINALVAALGVGSLAIALAAQDTIANIIAGFLIMIDAPFKEGDRIKIPTGEIVQVLEIGVRRSKFLAEDKSIIIVPNVDLSRSKIVNYSYGEKGTK